MDDIIINAIIYIDPFYPFYLSTIYIVMKNSLTNINLLNYFPGFLPFNYIVFPAFIIDGLIFFIIAVIADYKMNIRFRVKDGKRP